MLAILPCHISLIPIYISDCCQFSDIHISQGSVVTHLRCGGIFKYEFVANLPLSLSAKELWKSVIIWGSYGQEFSVLFFIDSRCRSVYFTVHHKIALVETQSTDHSWENDLLALSFLIDWLIFTTGFLMVRWQIFFVSCLVAIPKLYHKFHVVCTFLLQMAFI